MTQTKQKMRKNNKQQKGEEITQDGKSMQDLKNWRLDKRGNKKKNPD